MKKAPTYRWRLYQLYHVRNLSTRQIADMMGCAYQTIALRLRRALIESRPAQRLPSDTHAGFIPSAKILNDKGYFRQGDIVPAHYLWQWPEADGLDVPDGLEFEWKGKKYRREDDWFVIVEENA